MTENKVGSVKISAVLVDDDPQCLETLQAIFKEYVQEIDVVATFTDAFKALRSLSSLSVDLIFLDIEMPGLNGLEFVKKLPELENTSIVFITAFDSYAIKAIKAGAFDYILKPPSIGELIECVEKIKIKIGKRTNSDNSEVIKNNSIVINRQDKCLVIDYNEINRLNAAGPYCHIILVNDQRFVSTKPMGYFEKQLLKNGFVRLHRSHIINVSNIKEIQKDKGDGILLFKDGSILELTRDFKNELIRYLDNGD